MTTLDLVCRFLAEFAPPILAAQWDNVGLLVGDRQADIRSVMTCLTVTPGTAAEAIDQKADLIVSHHPLPFHALKRLTTDTTPGRLLWDLIGHRIAIYSPHTSFDSAASGINHQLAMGLNLRAIAPLVPIDGAPEGTGSGRFGHLDRPCKLLEIAEQLKTFLGIDLIQVVGPLDRNVVRVAVACGAAGEFLEVARQADCQLLIVGETNLHTCLEAESTDVAMLLPGHYASERFAVERLAGVLADQFPELTVWASKQESDPLKWI